MKAQRIELFLIELHEDENLEDQMRKMGYTVIEAKQKGRDFRKKLNIYEVKAIKEE